MLFEAARLTHACLSSPKRCSAVVVVVAVVLADTAPLLQAQEAEADTERSVEECHRHHAVDNSSMHSRQGAEESVEADSHTAGGALEVEEARSTPVPGRFEDKAARTVGRNHRLAATDNCCTEAPAGAVVNSIVHEKVPADTQHLVVEEVERHIAAAEAVETADIGTVMMWESERNASSHC